MNKTPEEYFQEQEFAAEALETHEEFTSAEKAFIEKYLGLGEEDLLEKLGIEAPVEVRTVSLPEPPPLVAAAPDEAAPDEAAPDEAAQDETVADDNVREIPDLIRPEEAQAWQGDSTYLETMVAPLPADLEGLVARLALDLEPGKAETPETLPALEPALAKALSLDAQLRQEAELQLMSFFLGQQEYTLPIRAVQEVIRYVTPTKLPGSSSTFAGVINLRGKVTPLFKLSELIGMKTKSDAAADEQDQDKFIIVCRHKGLQLGLIVRNVATIYRVAQKRIEWNIETRLGGDIDLVTALMKTGDYLVGIFSIDRIIDKVLRT